MDWPFVTIFVPCRVIDNPTRECVARCHELEYPKFEILVLPDQDGEVEGAIVVATGPVSPGRKRNLGASIARGEVFAYIDSDAFPKRDWITNAVVHLRKVGVGAVGGPAVTPSSDSGFAQAQGAMLSSSRVGGLYSRYKESATRESDDIHSVNFVAWRRVIAAVGGWNELYWPGEDTLICLQIKKADYRQLMASDVIVYHHRRSTWTSYLKQIRNFGLHRGYFAKRFPETSRRLSYFLPSIWCVSVATLLFLSIVFSFLWWVVLAALATYFITIGAIALNNIKNRLTIFVGLPLTHLVYGTSFLQGLMSRRLCR
jgi:cellulose synthase/poly-beta-1,6-N-acetylglucosamine synthase-like glycosyltransferase